MNESLSIRMCITLGYNEKIQPVPAREFLISGFDCIFISTLSGNQIFSKNSFLKSLTSLLLSLFFRNGKGLARLWRQLIERLILSKKVVKAKFLFYSETLPFIFRICQHFTNNRMPRFSCKGQVNFRAAVIQSPFWIIQSPERCALSYFLTYDDNRDYRILLVPETYLKIVNLLTIFT